MSKTLTLDVGSRFRLVNQILPKEAGSFKQAKAVRALRRRLELTDSEKKRGGYAEKDGRMFLQQPQHIEDKEFEFSDAEEEVIAWGFDRLDEEGNVPTDDQFFALYEEFEEAIESIHAD